MVKRNVVTGFVSLLVSACASSSPPAAAPNVQAADLSPADERAPAKKADPLSGTPVTVTPATPPSTGSRTCDEKVAAAKASGALGQVAEDPAVDPACQWRIDDARNDVTLGAASASLSTPAGNASPGMLASSGAAPPEVIGAAFRLHAADIAACARNVAGAPPVLRVRVVTDASGTATWAGADYRAQLPDAARACIESALRGKPFLTRSPAHVTATYGFAFAPKENR